MFDWNQLKEKVDKWQKLFDETVELIGNGTVKFNKNISCYHKFAPRVFEMATLKEIKVDDNLIKGDIILTVTNHFVGQDFRIVISRAFEAKAFGELSNPEIVLIKIKDYLNKNNTQLIEEFAMSAL